MSIEEKDLQSVEENDKPIEEDSDFADEVKPIEAPKQEPVSTEAQEEEGIDLHYAEDETTSVAKEESPVGQTYDDPSLDGIENARLEFYKLYKKSNIIKWIVTGVSLVLIVCGWLIPNSIEAIKEYSMVIALICCGVGLVALLVFNGFFKKKVQEAMRHYFNKYYEYTNAYAFPTNIDHLEGSVDSKLETEEFKECNLFKDVTKVGSRACYTFKYHGKSIKIADAAAQIAGNRMLQTVFVGKYLYTTNDYQGSDILIYFKGNKRALPPTNLAGRKVLSDSKNMVIYADKDAEKILTPEFRSALKGFRTNKTFVDMSISIREGKTYFAMGYEDDLMIIALEKPFNPGPTQQYRDDLAKVLNIVDLMGKKSSVTTD